MFESSKPSDLQEALEAELHAAACLPARPSERDERAGRDATDALEQRQGTARRRQEKAIRKWAELETQVAAAVSGLEGLVHVLEARAPVSTVFQRLVYRRVRGRGLVDWLSLSRQKILRNS